MNYLVVIDLLIRKDGNLIEFIRELNVINYRI